jgi:hypothetical protein
VDRSQIGAEPVNPPERRVHAAKERGCIGLGGDVDVTALAVGYDEKALLLGVGDDLREHTAAGDAQPLEARQLGLHRYARLAGRVDQRPAVCEHRRARPIGDRGGLRAVVAPGPERPGVRVQAENQLRLALGDARRERVAE